MFTRDLLAERARVTPDKLAVVSVETAERLTYAELDARAVAAAAHLSSLGIEAGDRFGLLMPNSIDFVATFFGAIKSGAIVVPLSMRATEHEFDGIAADCGMKVMLDKVPSVGAGFSPPAEGGLKPAPTGYDPEAIACLLYTSGTTGKPKGVMIPRRQLFWNGYNTALNWRLRDDDVSPVFTPMHHAGGLAAFLIPIFCAGGTVVIHKQFNPKEVWETIERERCTVILGVPTIWKMLAEAPEFATVDLSSVRWLISGGAPLPEAVRETYWRRGIPMKQGYGMTEVGVNCFTMTVEDARRKPGSIGTPMMFTEVRLVDADANEVAEGEIGEMEIRGPHVSKGYWNNEEATRAAYRKDGWLRTGDLARRDEDGFFYIAGRRKEMFISGGVNVYPAEIEAELLAHPSVGDAAVVAVPDDTWGEVGVAFVVCSGVTADELTLHLASRIAKYKVPRRFVFLDALPRTAYGKVVKDELRGMLRGTP